MDIIYQSLMELRTSHQLPFSRLHPNLTLSRTSPNPFSSPRLTESQPNSSTVSNIKNLCLSLLQTHNAVDLQNLRAVTPLGVSTTKSSHRFKQFKDRMVEDSSVRFQQTLDLSLDNILSQSKSRGFLKPKITTLSKSKSKEKALQPRSIQKKVFEYILEQYKDNNVTVQTPLSKTKPKQDEERILQYFQTKKRFISKIQKLPNYSKYLTPGDIDTLFKECFSDNIPESAWQLHVVDHIESRRKKIGVMFI